MKSNDSGFLLPHQFVSQATGVNEYLTLTQILRENGDQERQAPILAGLSYSELWGGQYYCWFVVMAYDLRLTQIRSQNYIVFCSLFNYLGC